MGRWWRRAPAASRTRVVSNPSISGSQPRRTSSAAGRGIGPASATTLRRAHPKSILGRGTQSTERRAGRARPRITRGRGDTGDVDPDRDRRRGLGGGRAGAPGGEVRAQQGPGDRARRPPERVAAGRVLRRGALGADGDIPPRALVVGVEEPGQDGRRGRGPNGEAELREHRARGRVGLLRGERALLERERGGVAGREHSWDAVDPAVRVDGNKARVVVGEAVDEASHGLRQGDSAVRADRPAVGQAQLSVAGGDGARARDEGHPTGREQTGDGGAGRRAQELEWRRLGSDDRDLRPQTAVTQLDGREERELVERHGPGQPGTRPRTPAADATGARPRR